MAEFISTPIKNAGLSAASLFPPMCGRSTSARRSLVAAIVCLLFASEVHALPFRFACIPEGSQVTSIECRLVSEGMLADSVDVLPTTTGASASLVGSIARFPPAFEINSAEPEEILFSLTTHQSELQVIATMRNETLRAAVREMVPGNGASYAHAERDPVARPVALLLISSGGIAGVGVASRRRRGLRRLSRIQAPRALGKEASSSTTIVASLFAQGSSHSTPLRI